MTITFKWQVFQEKNEKITRRSFAIESRLAYADRREPPFPAQFLHVVPTPSPTKDFENGPFIRLRCPRIRFIFLFRFGIAALCAGRGLSAAVELRCADAKGRSDRVDTVGRADAGQFLCGRLLLYRWDEELSLVSLKLEARGRSATVC